MLEHKTMQIIVDGLNSLGLLNRQDPTQLAILASYKEVLI